MDQLITRHDIDITRPGPMQAGDPDRPIRLKVATCYMDLTETNAATIGQRLIDASDPDHAAELAATHRPIDLNDLTPRPTDPAHGHTQHAWMRKQLNRYSCHGLAMTVDPTGIDGSATLVVAYTAADSRRPGHEIALKARRAIGPYPTLDETAFARDLRNALLHGVFAHELDEHLTRDGKLLNDPHTDPTRWHCHHCGGVGPTRHEGNQWRCPECGQLTTLPDTTKTVQKGQSPQAPGAVLGSVPRAQDVPGQSLRELLIATGAFSDAAADRVVQAHQDELAAEIDRLTAIVHGYRRVVAGSGLRRVVAAAEALERSLRGLTVPREVTAYRAQLCEAIASTAVDDPEAAAAAPRAEPVDGEGTVVDAAGSYGNTNLGLIVAQLDTMLIDRHGDDETYWAAKDALRTEMNARRERPAETDPLMRNIDLFADLRRIAAGESDSGFELVEARAELVRDDIAGKIWALRGQVDKARTLLADILAESDQYDNGIQPIGYNCSLRPMLNAQAWLAEHPAQSTSERDA